MSALKTRCPELFWSTLLKAADDYLIHKEGVALYDRDRAWRMALVWARGKPDDYVIKVQDVRALV